MHAFCEFAYLDSHHDFLVACHAIRVLHGFSHLLHLCLKTVRTSFKSVPCVSVSFQFILCFVHLVTDQLVDCQRVADLCASSCRTHSSACTDCCQTSSSRERGSAESTYDEHATDNSGRSTSHCSHIRVVLVPVNCRDRTVQQEHRLVTSLLEVAVGVLKLVNEPLEVMSDLLDFFKDCELLWTSLKFYVVVC